MYIYCTVLCCKPHTLCVLKYVTLYALNEQMEQYKTALVVAAASLDTAHSLEAPLLTAKSLAAVAKCKHVLAAGHKRELVAVLSLLKQQAAILHTILTAAAIHASSSSVCSASGSTSSSVKSKSKRAAAAAKVRTYSARLRLQHSLRSNHEPFCDVCLFKLVFT
jgi:hypothetical protein